MNNFLLFLGGLLAGIAVTAVFVYFVAKGSLFVVDESRYDFDKTVEQIELMAKEKSWTISHLYNLQATMEKNGYQVEPVMVFSMCKPGIAKTILSSDSERPASALMPCRVSVYRKSDGRVYISRMNAGMFARLMPGPARGAMQLAAKENEEILSSIINR